MQGGTGGFHGLEKVRENRQADHHGVLCFRGPEQHLVFKFHHVKYSLFFLFSSIVNVNFKNTHFVTVLNLQ